MGVENWITLKFFATVGKEIQNFQLLSFSLGLAANHSLTLTSHDVVVSFLNFCKFVFPFTPGLFSFAAESHPFFIFIFWVEKNIGFAYLLFGRYRFL